MGGGAQLEFTRHDYSSQWFLQPEVQTREATTMRNPCSPTRQRPLLAAAREKARTKSQHSQQLINKQNLMYEQRWPLLWLELPQVTWVGGEGVVRNGGFYWNIRISNPEIWLTTPLYVMFSRQIRMVYIILFFFLNKICLPQCEYQQLRCIFWSSKKTSPWTPAEFFSALL